MAQAGHFDLEERTLSFTKLVILFCKKINIHIFNRNIIVQLLRSSASIGANYREANNALSKRDFFLRLKIARKEAKETSYWLECITFSSVLNSDDAEALEKVKKEAKELCLILSSIIHQQKE